MESFFREHARRLDDFLWLLAPAAQPELRSLTVGDGFTSFPSREDWTPLAADAPLMLLLHREDRPAAIDSLVLILPADQRRWAQALSVERHGHAATLELLPGAVDTDWVLLSVIATPGAPTDALHPFIGRIFARFLITGRPLRNYHGSFMLPLDLRLDDELDQAIDRIPALAIDAGERIERVRIEAPASPQRAGDDPKQLVAAYLRTPLQRRLFETDTGTGAGPESGADIIHWRIPPDQCRDWTLQVDDPHGPGFAAGTGTRASLDGVSLYQYYNGLFLLVLRVSMPTANDADDFPVPDDPHWWQPLLFNDGPEWTAITATPIGRWLRFSQRVQRLYSEPGTAPDEDDSGLLRLRDATRTLAEMPPDSPFSEVVVCLLRRFLPGLPERQLQRDQRLSQVAGPRMFTHAAYTLQGPAPADDAGGDDYRRLFGDALHGHWANAAPIPGDPARVTAQGNAFIGCERRFSHFVAPIQVPYLFVGLQAPVLLFRASLDLFERRLGDAVGDLHHWRGRPAAFDRVHADFIDFIDRHWSTSLSAQPDADDIAARMMAAQDLPGRYRRLADKIARTNDYAATRPHRDRRPTTRGLAWAGLLMGIVALAWLFTSR